jgi:hypothetical protein
MIDHKPGSPSLQITTSRRPHLCRVPHTLSDHLAAGARWQLHAQSAEAQLLADRLSQRVRALIEHSERLCKAHHQVWAEIAAARHWRAEAGRGEEIP